MSTPEYLRTADRAAGRGQGGMLLVIALLCAANLALVSVMAVRAGGRGAAAERQGWTAAHQRALAARFLTEGMKEQALAAFDAYRASAALSSTEVANVSYLMGKTCMELQRYDEALGHLYRVELADARSAVLDDARRAIITCLEQMGRTVDARYALDKHTALSRAAATQDVRGVVVAMIGDEAISLGDVHDALQQMPPAQQRALDTPAQREELVRQLVLERLLYKKGVAAGHDRAPDVQAQVRAAERQMIVQRVLDRDLRARVNVAPDDVKLYYDAHPELFSTPARAKLSCVTFAAADEAWQALHAVRDADDATGAFARIAGAARGRGAFVQGWISANGLMAGLGSEPALAQAALAQQHGLITNAVPTSRGAVIAHVDAYEAPRKKPFESVRTEAERRYRAEKEQRALDEMAGELSRAYRVQVYPERITPRVNEGGAGSATK